MGDRHSARRRNLEKGGEVTIEGLNSEIAKLNDELTCASEAYHALKIENERMKAALKAAEKAFRSAGDKEMVKRMKAGITGEIPRTIGFRFPSANHSWR